MLKIKDNVDLKELEKFGLKFNENKEYKNPFYHTKGLFIWCKDRLIASKCIYSQTKAAFDTLYELIQAGLVEKMEVK